MGIGDTRITYIVSLWWIYMLIVNRIIDDEFPAHVNVAASEKTTQRGRNGGKLHLSDYCILP